MKIRLLCAGLISIAVGCTVFNTPPDPRPSPTEGTDPTDAASQHLLDDPDADHDDGGGRGQPPADPPEIDAGSVSTAGDSTNDAR